jgi:ubiquinone/menaquinone biosynthesis C-methylase UbiE
VTETAHPPAWYLDELAHAGPEHLDADYVAEYTRKAGTDPAPEVERLRQLGLGPDSTLVDLGAGTGTFALAAAPACREVIAVDVSAVMLDVLQREADKRGVRNVRCVRAGFLSYTARDVDFVYSRHALHQLPDFWKAVALRRIADMLRPSGFLRLRDLFFSCELAELAQVVDTWLEGAATDARRGWTRAEYETHLRDEFSTFTWLFEPMLQHAGFEVLDASYASSRIYAEYTCRLAHC